ncbi:PHA/PHB synthase family protein [Allopusillimonas ginsengisoli]|uniref:PHA/PHB synthase family protein n=1 Tax=Allopusillimonas ginsengisoli TaxID=453575 RepID=UPI0010227B7C|nr:class I poly(R)-hydroxyalkanoic acid synthase [Allopusillimonas ginsengisoli]TEA78456.1 class I poly(R)-hydroxyalkanoic acid synthase [Allopusillimonas ginsengisoli]
MSANTNIKWPAPANIEPERLAQIQAEFAKGWLEAATQAQQGALRPPRDRRFHDEAWAASPAHAFLAHAYVLTANAMDQMVDAVQVDESVRDRLRFAAMQWVHAVSPSNFLATNPVAQRAMLQTQGQSLRKGVQNLFKDIQQGRLTQSDETPFDLGRNIAATEGSVVFENPLMQLIQYAPLTPKTYQRPLLIVPPCINKYYILDLQESNSFVQYALEQGHTVFLISWRNPLPSDNDDIQHATWADYLQNGVLKAIEVACAITRQPQLNALGFCVGGTLLASALALARAQGKDPACSLTLLTTLLDFERTGVLDVFVDECHAQLREHQLGHGGLMTARELGTTFSFLRPGELVWNYVTSNYLMGDVPPPFDLLYWNADGTNLPGPFFTWYFRNTYLENNLKVPGRIKVDGYALDLGTVDMPAYVYGSHDDHIVPWHAAYASSHLLGGPVRFVLGASGHIAGVINPPSKGRRHYWTLEEESVRGGKARDGDPAAWLEAAGQQPGSWWPDWSEWLASQSGSTVRARAKPGNAKYQLIEPAPGRYALTRAV